MRLPLFSTIALTALTVGALAIGFETTSAEASGGSCLRVRDMTSLTKVDNKTLMAHTRSSKKYVVRLRHACRDFGRPGNYYKLRLHSDTECFDRDDVLVFRDGGSCFIESVRPA
jgi:Family of unknown function (DUF6491)